MRATTPNANMHAAANDQRVFAISLGMPIQCGNGLSVPTETAYFVGGRSSFEWR